MPSDGVEEEAGSVLTLRKAGPELGGFPEYVRLLYVRAEGGERERVGYIAVREEESVSACISVLLNQVGEAALLGFGARLLLSQLIEIYTLSRLPRSLALLPDDEEEAKMGTCLLRKLQPRRSIHSMDLSIFIPLCIVVLLAVASPAESHFSGLHFRRAIEDHQRQHVADFYSLAGTHRRTLASEQIDPLDFDNDRLRDAYIALQAWKKVIFSDPANVTASWVGPDVCMYEGVFCAPALDDPCDETVAGIDLNHKDLAGYLPEELGLLKDLALIHLNSNRFCGVVPLSFANLKLLHELDLSNNRFVGPFPNVVLSLPSLKYLDLRFNEFEGALPADLFSKDLDAIFINDNRFSSSIPPTLGLSPVSVLVLANTPVSGCVPAGIGGMSENLNEIILLNNNLTGCLNPSIGQLANLTVLDLSFNGLLGKLPETLAQLTQLEQLNVAHNAFSGNVPPEICALPNLENFTYSYNFFESEAQNCLALPSRGATFSDRQNCIPGRPAQRSFKECAAFLSHQPSCEEIV
ncbi:hypothetical protein GOP47_0006179, partial [Adiantum capillus-veneris]